MASRGPGAHGKALQADGTHHRPHARGRLHGRQRRRRQRLSNGLRPRRAGALAAAALAAAVNAGTVRVVVVAHAADAAAAGARMTTESCMA